MKVSIRRNSWKSCKPNQSSESTAREGEWHHNEARGRDFHSTSCNTIVLLTAQVYYLKSKTSVIKTKQNKTSGFRII